MSSCSSSPGPYSTDDDECKKQRVIQDADADQIEEENPLSLHGVIQDAGADQIEEENPLSLHGVIQDADADQRIEEENPLSLSPSTKKRRRIDFLARPKRFAPGFERDRRSVYWVEREPSRPAPGGTTASIATTRVEQLAQHRNPVQQWRGDRITPIWAVSDGAQKAAATKRVVYLARHKDVNPKHRMERSPYYVLRDSSGVCTCPSARIEHLAEHKDRRDKFEVEEKEWGQYFHVPGPALIANASERVERLAEAKQNHKDFSGEKPVQWPISEQALTSLASLRLQQLSRPRSHTMIRDDYNPYKVTPAARKAHPTPRVEELCAPIPRKQRTKKIV